MILYLDAFFENIYIDNKNDPKSSILLQLKEPKRYKHSW